MALPSTNVNYVIIDPFDQTGALDTTGLYAVGNGFLAESSDGGQNWTDLSSAMGTPPNTAGDSPAPSVSDINFTHIVADIYTDNQIIGYGNWTNGAGVERSFIAKRNGAGTWSWQQGEGTTSGGTDPASLSGWIAHVNADLEAYSDSAAVTTITNQVGTNFTGGNDPTFRTGGQNGRSSYEFDGVNDYKTVGSAFGRPANWTMIVALKTSDGTKQIVAGSSASGGSDTTQWGLLRLEGGEAEYSFGDDTNFSAGATTSTPVSNTTWHIFALRYTAGDTDVDVWVNSTNETITTTSTAASASTGTTYDYVLGRAGECSTSGDCASIYFNGQIGQFYLDNTARSDSDIENSITFLRDYYAIGVAPGQSRQLSLEIDKHSGANIYNTRWDATNIVLEKRTVSSLAVATTKTLGASTDAQLDNKTYYAQVFTPPTSFGDADTVYVFGRWTDGTVRHLQKSTDGGATLSDIGDSATWGTDYISAFFATDANTLFAFRAGATKALYRSQDAGVTWDNLGALPFNVVAASLGADGRIAIANLDSGATQASTASGPLFSSWTNITGTLPTNAKGSIVWV